MNRNVKTWFDEVPEQLVARTRPEAPHRHGSPYSSDRFPAPALNVGHPGRVRQDIGVHVRLGYENRVLRSALHGGIDGVDQLIVGHTVSGVLDPVMLPLRSGGAALYRLVQLPFGVLADAGVAGPPPGGGGTLSTCSNVAQNHVGGVVGVNRRM